MEGIGLGEKVMGEEDILEREKWSIVILTSQGYPRNRICQYVAWGRLMLTFNFPFVSVTKLLFINTISLLSRPHG